MSFLLALPLSTALIPASSAAAEPMSVMAPQPLARMRSAAWEPHPGPPPIRRFYGPDTQKEFLSFPSAVGEVLYFARSPEVKIYWESRGTQAFLSQRLALSYWPTWVLSSADGKAIVVGGKRRSNGHTVIERWTLTAPLEFRDMNDPDRGTLVPAQVVSVENIFDEAIEGMDYVRSIVAVRGAEDSYLVRFDDSGDVYSFAFNAATEQWDHEVRASVATSAPGIVSTPGLGSMTIKAWTADHASEGFIYCFGQGPTLSPHATVVLTDIDRNGTLDNAMTLSTEEWNSSVFARADEYVELAK